MVYLSRIYTKFGDKGQTMLGDGSTVFKASTRIDAIGEVDELNSVIGVAMAHGGNTQTAYDLGRIQNDLFDLGADLAVPGDDQSRLRITAAQVERLEDLIDRHTAALTPLHSFILPGGSAASAYLHLARTVCRRAERTVCELAGMTVANGWPQELGGGTSPQVPIYLNRLSDVLFIMARAANKNGAADVLWVPGKDRV